jgi:acetylornithine aminotransferase
VLGPGNHGTTFGGNPLAMRASLETLRIMEADGLLENAATVGSALRAGLARELAGVAGVVDIRGQGLMIGVGCRALVASCSAARRPGAC